jgi:hypothetical protein
VKTKTLKTEELEEKLNTALKDNKSLKSDMADMLMKQENNSENEHMLQLEAEELKNKLKVNENIAENLTWNIIAEGLHYCSFHLSAVVCVSVLCAVAGGYRLLERCNTSLFSNLYSEDGGHMSLLNVDTHLSDYAVNCIMSFCHRVNLRSHTLLIS